MCVCVCVCVQCELVFKVTFRYTHKLIKELGRRVNGNVLAESIVIWAIEPHLTPT